MRARPVRRSLAGAGGGLRGHAARLRRLRGRGLRHRRARAARAARRPGLGPHGRRRGDHESRGGAHRLARQREAVGQLDGRRRLSRRGRRALRHGTRRGARALPGARHLDPGGQGLPVHAHRLGRKGSGRAAVAHRLGLRAGRRRARHAHAAAAQRRRRQRARARRPRPRQEPPRRLDPGAGPRRAWRCLPRPRRSGAAEEFLCGAAGAGAAGARVPRPVRRRAVRHRLRDVVRRALRRDAQHGFDQLRPGGGRRRRVQARRRRAARGPRQGPGARRAVLRGAGRGAAGPRLGSAARDADLARRRSRRVLASHRPAQPARRGSHHAQRQAALLEQARPRAAHLERDHLAHAGAARPPGMRAGGVRPHHRSQGSGPLGASDFSRERRYSCDRRSPPHRNSSGAGRERPCRDGGGVRPRRLRGGGRAHDRPHRRPRLAGGVQGLCRGRRIFLRRRARRRPRLGEHDPVQLQGPGRVRAILRAPRYVRARRLQRLPDDGGAEGADPGRRALAGIREEPLRAVRRAPGDGRDHAEPVAVLRRHGRQPHADRHRPRRRPCRVSGKSRSRDMGGHALCRQPRPRHRNLPLQSERLAAGHHRAHHARRPLHHRHAAPGTGLPQRAAFLVA